MPLDTEGLDGHVDDRDVDDDLLAQRVECQPAGGRHFRARRQDRDVGDEHHGEHDVAPDVEIFPPVPDLHGGQGDYVSQQKAERRYHTRGMHDRRHVGRESGNPDERDPAHDRQRNADAARPSQPPPARHDDRRVEAERADSKADDCERHHEQDGGGHVQVARRGACRPEVAEEVHRERVAAGVVVEIPAPRVQDHRDSGEEHEERRGNDEEITTLSGALDSYSGLPESSHLSVLKPAALQIQPPGPAAAQEMIAHGRGLFRGIGDRGSHGARDRPIRDANGAAEQAPDRCGKRAPGGKTAAGSSVCGAPESGLFLTRQRLPVRSPSGSTASSRVGGSTNERLPVTVHVRSVGRVGFA